MSRTRGRGAPSDAAARAEVVALARRDVDLATGALAVPGSRGRPGRTAAVAGGALRAVADLVAARGDAPGPSSAASGAAGGSRAAR